MEDDDSVEVQDLAVLPEGSIVIDVRPEIEFAMFSLPNTVNIPYTEILKNEGLDALRKEITSRGTEKTLSKFSSDLILKCCYF